MMCACACRKTSSPRRVSARTAAWLHIVPEGKYRPASLPSSPAAYSCRRMTVGSSPRTSSPTSASSMARRISADGRVTVSLRRSIVFMSPFWSGARRATPVAAKATRAAGAAPLRRRGDGGEAGVLRLPRGAPPADCREGHPGRRHSALEPIAGQQPGEHVPQRDDREPESQKQDPDPRGGRPEDGDLVGDLLAAGGSRPASAGRSGRPAGRRAARRRSPWHWPACPGSRPRCGRGSCAVRWGCPWP